MKTLVIMKDRSRVIFNVPDHIFWLDGYFGACAYITYELHDTWESWEILRTARCVNDIFTLAGYRYEDCYNDELSRDI